MIATAHVGVPKTFWPRTIARVHQFAGEARKAHHQNAANCCRTFVDVINFIEEFSRLGDPEFVQAAAGLLGEVVNAISGLDSLSDELKVQFTALREALR
jgi:hypothetical protein